jgi:hypothetical protein
MSLLTNTHEDENPAKWLKTFANSPIHRGQIRARLTAIADLLDMTLHVRDMQAGLLTEIVNTLKGPPEVGTVHGLTDVVEIIADMMVKSGRVAAPTEVH